MVPRRVGFPALWRNRCGRTRTAPERARWVRNTRRIRLGQRPTRRRAAQHHEALRGGAAHWAFVAKVGPQFGEERPVDGHHPFPAALAGHPHPAQAHVHIGQPQRADLRRAQPAQRHQQHHRAVPVGVQVRVQEPLNGRHQDEAGRDEDQQTFDAGGEVLGLAVPEVVVVISGPGGHRQGDQGDDGRDQVHSRLGGVRE
jgi:hypothetical protein